MEYTPRQILEIKGAFYYIVTFGSIAVVSLILQYFGAAGLPAMLINIVMNSFNIFLAIMIYNRKKKNLKATITPWVLGFTSSAVLILAKYQYALTSGWTFASLSINTTGLLIIYVILLYLFYQPRLFKFFSVYAICHWILFLYLAYRNGAEFYFQTYVKGKAVQSGLIVWSEVAFIFFTSIIFVVIYKNLTGVIRYDDQSSTQHDQILNQSETQNKMSDIIKEKTDSLFQKINAQHTLLNNFNSNMDDQAARFTEMASTMEDISGAAEQIATESVTQFEGNIQMESIIEEFRGIRLETKQNLDETYIDIQSVTDQSATANEHLMQVEQTVYEIKDQSSRIGQIVELIVDIADRINLLSLNASIEAARAGEAGRGFAVVADEIGKLAFQTQESIKEINNVISISSKSTIDGAAVIQKTAQMMRAMISRMNESANKVQILQETLLIEDRFTKVLIDQMNANITQAKKISIATDEQKVAVGTYFKALEELIGGLDGMVAELNNMAKIYNEIHNSAADIVTVDSYYASAIGAINVDADDDIVEEE